MFSNINLKRTRARKGNCGKNFIWLRVGAIYKIVMDVVLYNDSLLVKPKLKGSGQSRKY